MITKRLQCFLFPTTTIPNPYSALGLHQTTNRRLDGTVAPLRNSPLIAGLISSSRKYPQHLLPRILVTQTNLDPACESAPCDERCAPTDRRRPDQQPDDLLFARCATRSTRVERKKLLEDAALPEALHIPWRSQSIDEVV